MSSETGRIETNGGDYFGNQKKKLAIADRRPVIRRASDLVGPGISANSVRLTNFNDLLATYNGFYSAAPGAAWAPNETEAFVGFVSSDAELGGVQQFTSLATGDLWTRAFNRNPLDAGAIYWADWKYLSPVVPI